MNPIRVAAAVLNQTPLDWDGNAANIVAAIQAARQRQVAVLCLPELCITGYGCEDAFLSDATLRMAANVLREVALSTDGIIVSLGLPILVEGGRYNAASLVADGKVLGMVCKQFLANDGIHYEPRWFRPWAPGRTATIELGDQKVPVGDLVFDVGSLRLGFEICEDAWVATRPAYRLAQRQVDLILCPSASHFAFGKQPIRRRLAIEGSRIARCGYVYTNLLGNEAGRAIYDGGPLIATDGELLAAGPRFSFRGLQLTTAVMDIQRMRDRREQLISQPSSQPQPETQPASTKQPETAAPDSSPDESSSKSSLDPAQTTARGAGSSAAVSVSCDRVAADLPTRVIVDHQFPAAAVSTDSLDSTSADGGTVSPDQDAVTLSSDQDAGAVATKEEEFAHAVALGLFDYLRKSRSRGFVVSLSGGADSAAVATLVSLAVRFGVAELGAKALVDKLRYIESLTKLAPTDRTPRNLVPRLLTCVYQSTRNSSNTTRNAAQQVAEAVGARFIQLDVDSLVEGYIDHISQAIGRPLTWETDDLALQNIQARVRAPSVWLLANLQQSLLLSTSNRSEAAVGYATMDGDTSGGLAPIAGIDKAFLRRWLRWMETTGPDGLGPLPALRAINEQQPTAELRPKEAEQTDEGDLMPYEVLDAIERAAIRDKRDPLEVFRVVEPSFPRYNRRQLAEWVERFFRLWSRNQWKRERYAPSFHLDDENLDPKTWCRFPILSGGFERELAALRAAIEETADK